MDTEAPMDLYALTLATLNFVVATLNLIDWLAGQKAAAAWATIAWVGSGLYWVIRGFNLI